MNDQDRALLDDLKTLWDGMNAFFGSLTDADWHRSHGPDWTFDDVPYHLLAYHEMLLNAIRQGRNYDDYETLPQVTTLRELDAWNDARFEQRPEGYAPGQCFDLWCGSQSDLLTLVRQKSMDATVWLPVLRVRGWRTVRLTMAYALAHSWYHYMESHLIYHGKLPELSSRVMRRAVAFQMELIAGAVVSEAAMQPFSLEILVEGAGAWTIQIAQGRGSVLARSTPDADVRLSMSVQSFVQIMTLRRQNPVLAMLTLQIRVRKGLLKLNRMGQIFAITPDMTWQPMQQTDYQPARTAMEVS